MYGRAAGEGGKKRKRALPAYALPMPIGFIVKNDLFVIFVVCLLMAIVYVTLPYSKCHTLYSVCHT